MLWGKGSSPEKVGIQHRGGVKEEAIGCCAGVRMRVRSQGCDVGRYPNDGGRANRADGMVLASAKHVVPCIFVSTQGAGVRGGVPVLGGKRLFGTMDVPVIRQLGYSCS